jgi:hypothetical protein
MLPEPTGESSDQPHWSDVWKTGQEEFTHSDFSLTEFLNGSKSTELDNSFHMMTKLKVKNPT